MKRRASIDAVPRAIVGFRQDEEGHWVARLACGHEQHVRHRPPFTERTWVLTAKGRAEHIGVELPCRRCIEADPVATKDGD